MASRRVFGVALVLLAALCAAPRPARAGPEDAGAGPSPVRVIVPDPDNLQYLSFWVALGAGFFAAEGLVVEVVSPRMAALVHQMLDAGEAPVAVLPPPAYLRLVAEGRPIRIVANLLQNDGINLIVRRSVAEERKLSRAAPLRDRLHGLRGLKLGVAPGPTKRLRALFAAEGLRADDEVEVVVVPGQEQNLRFGEGKIDAIFVHTPYLEKALLDQDAVLLIHASGGDAPLLAGLQIHALVVTTAFAEAHPDAVLRLVRAIQRAQRLVHDDRAAATDAVLRALPALERRLVEAVVALYEPAVPAGPRVSAELLPRSAALYPAMKDLPALGGAELAVFVEPRFAEQALREAGAPAAAAAAAAAPAPWRWIAGAAAVALAALLVAAARRKVRRAGP